MLNIIFIIIGVILGAICICLIKLTIKNKNEVFSYYDDDSPAKFFITGDKHRNFSRIKKFCRDMNTRRKDVLIVLGDANSKVIEQYGLDKKEWALYNYGQEVEGVKGR